MKKWIKLIPAVLLGVIVLYLGITNRSILMNRLKGLSASNFGQFANGLEADLTDGMEQKGEALDVYSAMEDTLGINEVNDVVRLANNYLTNQTTNYNYEEIFAEMIMMLKDQLNSDGVNFLCVPMMSKENFYDVPWLPGYEADYNANIANFYPMLEARNVPYVNLDAFFRENEWSIEDVYFKTDHHWNPRAAFAAVEEIVKEMAEADSEIIYDESSFSEENWATDVYEDWFLGSWGKRTGSNFVGVDDLEYIYPTMDTDIVINRIRGDRTLDVEHQNTVYLEEYLDEPNYYDENPYNLYLGDNYPVAYIQNSKAVNDKKVIVIGDSYRMPAECFMATQFSEVYHIDMRFYEDGTFMEFVNSIHPDYVILLFNGVAGNANAGNTHLYGLTEWWSQFGEMIVSDTYMENETVRLEKSEEYVELNDGKISSGSYHMTVGDVWLKRDKSENSDPLGEIVQVSLVNSYNLDIVQSRYFISGYNDNQEWYFTVPSDTGLEYELIVYNGFKDDTLGNTTVVENITLERYE